MTILCKLLQTDYQNRINRVFQHIDHYLDSDQTKMVAIYHDSFKVQKQLELTASTSY